MHETRSLQCSEIITHSYLSRHTRIGENGFFSHNRRHSSTNKNMAPQIVLISGCSSGIGLATAVYLAKDDEKRFKVYATMRNLTKKGQLEDEGKENIGDTLIIKQMDVCSDESVNKAVKEILDAEGKIDVLFNNAGIGIIGISLEFVPMEMVKELFEVNYFGALRLIQAVIPSMKARQSGVIINNSSHYGIVGVPFVEIYCSSKFAIEGLTESIAPIMQHFNIRCCLLEPGPVRTMIIPKAEDWCQNSVEAPAADPKTRTMIELVTTNVKMEVERCMQDCEEVAQYVKEIILGEKCDLRYQTNEKFGSLEVAAKLVDPTGNKSVDIINKRYLSQQNQP
ncbi:retinol dehydrogenase 8-like [Montipora capricornis]|uniref:retinol dehydrogenase 8-like n=1 Tax=Montipora capricornis TaxID=246305 RepID=UPI0035F1B168